MTLASDEVLERGWMGRMTDFLPFLKVLNQLKVENLSIPERNGISNYL